MSQNYRQFQDEITPQQQKSSLELQIGGRNNSSTIQNKSQKSGVYNVTEHLMSPNQVAQIYNSRINIQSPQLNQGLSIEQVQENLLQYGYNVITPVKDDPEWKKFLKHCFGYLECLLLFASALCMVSFIYQGLQSDWICSAVLVGVVLLGATLAYVQEAKAGDVMKRFLNMLPPKCIVIRDGRAQEIEARELVPGDVVKLESGVKIPADLRIIWNMNLKIEQSSITGEVDAIEITIESQSQQALESCNIAFNSCLCMEGKAYGIVIRTGDQTLIGTIARQTSAPKVGDSTLRKEILYLVILLTKISVFMGILFFSVGIIQGAPLFAAFMNGFIMIIVANVPQGLPATVTSTLAIIAQRLGENNVFVKKLESLETLGSSTVIASDKTGTLTMNKMTVKNTVFIFIKWFGGQSQSDETLFADRKGYMANQDYFSLLQVASLCSRALVDQPLPNGYSDKDVDDCRILSDASEQGLTKFCLKFHDVFKYKNEYEKIFEIPFDSRKKWQLSIHQNQKEKFLAIKGAPEILIKKCKNYLQNNKEIPINNQFLNEYTKAYENFGRQGQRVLGFAKISLPNNQVEYSVKENNFPQEGYTFVGLMALVDPPKPGVPQAIQICRSAGIKVVMITGDHPLTAESIARQVGIITEQTTQDLAKELNVSVKQVNPYLAQAAVIYGPDIDAFTAQDWEAIISKKELVFARISPQQKTEIVAQFQKVGEIVAVTGDGVNDAIALKNADIGVAMGISGNDVAKDAADIIIMDDDFSSIVLGIREGRVLFDNLKKSITYTLTHMFPEVFPIILNLTVGLPLALNPLLLMTIDLLTELGPAISMAYEEAEHDIMDRKPRNMATDRLTSFPSLLYSLTAGVVECIACFMTYIFVFNSYGFSLSQLTNLGFTNFVPDCPPITAELNGAVYDSEQQDYILSVVQTSYYFTVVMSQFCNIWNCKTRNSSLFQHGVLNPYILIGVSIELLVMALCIYTPGLNYYIFHATPIWGYQCLYFIFTGVVLFFYSELRKWYSRRNPNSFVAKYINW